MFPQISSVMLNEFAVEVWKVSEGSRWLWRNAAKCLPETFFHKYNIFWTALQYYAYEFIPENSNSALDFVFLKLSSTPSEFRITIHWVGMDIFLEQHKL